MKDGLIRWTSGLMFVAALYLVFSPLWVHYTTGNRWEQIIVGAVVGILALVKMARPSSVWPSGINFLAGIWFIIAPWVLNNSTVAVKWNQVVLGVIVGGLALIELTASSEAETAPGLSSREESMSFGERITNRRDRQ